MMHQDSSYSASVSYILHSCMHVHNACSSCILHNVCMYMHSHTVLVCSCKSIIMYVHTVYLQHKLYTQPHNICSCHSIMMYPRLFRFSSTLISINIVLQHLHTHWELLKCHFFSFFSCGGCSSHSNPVLLDRPCPLGSTPSYSTSRSAIT